MFHTHMYKDTHVYVYMYVCIIYMWMYMHVCGKNVFEFLGGGDGVNSRVKKEMTCQKEQSRK